MSTAIARNCNSCRKLGLNTCLTLKANPEFRKLWDDRGQRKLSSMDAMLADRRLKDAFVCDDYSCRYMEFPIEVSAINYDTQITSLRSSAIGKMVSIRPCSEEYGNKTYLGLFLSLAYSKGRILLRFGRKRLTISAATRVLFRCTILMESSESSCKEQHGAQGLPCAPCIKEKEHETYSKEQWRYLGRNCLEPSHEHRGCLCLNEHQNHADGGRLFRRGWIRY